MTSSNSLAGLLTKIDVFKGQYSSCLARKVPPIPASGKNPTIYAMKEAILCRS